MDNIKEFWNQQSSRDQLYMVILGTCVAIYLLFMAVYQPVKNMRDAQMKTNESTAASLERVKALAAEYIATTASGTNKRGPSLDGVVQSSLSKNSLRASAVDSSGKNSIRVRLENAPFDNMLAWLYDMEVSQGMLIKDVSVAGGASPGTVSVNLRLQKD